MKTSPKPTAKERQMQKRIDLLEDELSTYLYCIRVIVGGAQTHLFQQQLKRKNGRTAIRRSN